MIGSLLFKSAVPAALGLFLAAGCASNGNGGGSAAAMAEHAVMCPQCETVWVKERQTMGAPKSRVTVLKSKATMVCPDCDTMAKAQLTSDGKVMLHNCEQCKVTPKAVDPAPTGLSPKGPHS